MSIVDVVRAVATSDRPRDAVRRHREPWRPPPWRHESSLDGLRGLAVIAVLLFHGGYLQGGFLGVDLFFALSGFLITSLLIRDATARGIDLVAFWGRRFRRLLPALFTMLVVVALWAAVWGSPAELASVRDDGPWALGYLANWHAVATSGGYWQSFSQPSMFDHLWSLAIEEQFYLVWPLLVVAVWRWAPRPSRALTTLCVTGIVVSLTAMLVLAGPGDPTRVYMGTDTRAASLLFGALAATRPIRRLVDELVRRLGGATTALVAVVGAAVLWSWAGIDGASSAVLYRGGLALHSALCALLVVTMATAPSSVGARALSWRPLAWVGAISYGLYLWHWPVYIALSPERTGLGGPTLFVLRVALSVAVAAISYQLVEDPIRRRAAWARGHAAAPALAGAVLAVAIVLAVLPAPATEIAAFDPSSIPNGATTVPPSSDIVTTTVSPAPETAPATAAPTVSTPTMSTPTMSAPTMSAPTMSAPTMSVAAPAPTEPPPPSPPPSPPPGTVAPPLAEIDHAVWAGDSIAWDMAPGVEAALDAADVPVDTSAAFVGMRLARADESTDLMRAVRLRLEDDGADTVILQLSVWDAKVDAAEQAAVLHGLHDLVVAHDARLVLVRPPVVAEEVENTGVVAMMAIADEISAADPGHVRVLDPTAVWGATAVQDVDGDGIPERKPDLTHVCPSGAARFGAWLAGELAARFEGVTPAAPEEWAGDDWVTDDRYDMPTGACAPVG